MPQLARWEPCGELTKLCRQSADAEKTQARYGDGVLSLTVPKREESKPKSLEINVVKQVIARCWKAGVGFPAPISCEL